MDRPMRVLIIQRDKDEALMLAKWIRFALPPQSDYRICNGIDTLHLKYDESKKRNCYFDIVVIGGESLVEIDYFYVACMDYEIALPETIKLLVLPQSSSDAMKNVDNPDHEKVEKFINYHGGWYINRPLEKIRFWAIMQEAEAAFDRWHGTDA